MAIYHKHHIVPRHMGGTDDPENLIELTIEDHAEAHRKLWEEHGYEYDRIAWLCLSGQISNAEANRLANVYWHKGKKPANMEKFLDAGKKSNTERLKNGTHNFLKLGYQKEVQLKRMKKGTHNFLNSEKQRELVMRQIERGTHFSQVKETCPHCGKTTNIPNIRRWHGDKCKKRGEI